MRPALLALCLLAVQSAGCQPTPPRVRTGLEVLLAGGCQELLGRRVGLLLHDASRTRDGTRADRALLSAGVPLVRLFTPEHGLSSRREGAVAASVDPASGLEVVSLYGELRSPPPEALSDLDLLVVDLQDAGARFYTYLATLEACLEACAAAGVDVLVLDRPNPLGGVRVEGPLPDPGRRSFVVPYPVPIRHGMTYAELARMMASEQGLPQPQCVAMQGWKRSMRYEETGRAWSAPSPNLPDPASCTLYPGVALIELTNVSVGRGTPRPFRRVGAPWIDDAEALAADFRALRLPGLEVSPARFVPERGPFAGQACAGIDLEPADPDRVEPVDVGLALVALLRRRWPERFEPERVDTLLARRDVLDALLAGRDPRSLANLWRADLEAFRARRRPFLLYPDPLS